MTEQTDWGFCKDCRWWQVEPTVVATNLTMGQCIEEKLQPFQLRVSGNSGCNRFRLGKPTKVEGASRVPPSTKPAE